MKQYVVDAFTDKVFSGNPAAVCIMDEWLPDDLMLKIAMENNLSETAFAVNEGDRYRLRWFTPGGEIDLCGHATLAAAYVLMNYYDKNMKEVVFSTMSGDLTVVRRNGALYEMDFPAYDLKPLKITGEMIAAIGAEPVEAYMGRDLLCVFDSQETVMTLNPDPEKLKSLDGLLFQATGPGKDTAASASADCVSRSFAPKLNVPEDPVCGSGHCHIVPYWAGPPGQRQHNRLSGIPAGRHSLLPHGRRPGKAGRKSRAFFSGGNFYLMILLRLAAFIGQGAGIGWLFLL